MLPPMPLFFPSSCCASASLCFCILLLSRPRLSFYLSAFVASGRKVLRLQQRLQARQQDSRKRKSCCCCCFSIQTESRRRRQPRHQHNTTHSTLSKRRGERRRRRPTPSRKTAKRGEESRILPRPPPPQLTDRVTADSRILPASQSVHSVICAASRRFIAVLCARLERGERADADAEEQERLLLLSRRGRILNTYSPTEWSPHLAVVNKGKPQH